MILSGDKILERLKAGEIFDEDTWDETAVKEASYTLRIANNRLLLDDVYYDIDQHFPQTFFEIQPGMIAILSTVEQLSIPKDLVGKIGIRLDYAAQGLVGLMGIQVDPGYGQDMKDRNDSRLFVRVANFGNKPIRLWYKDPVFTFELHEVSGDFTREFSTNKESTWTRLQRSPADQGQASWTHLTQIESDFERQAKTLRQELETDVANIRQSLQPVIMFGVFLVAVTILGVAITLILTVRDTPSTEVPSWVTSWGWMLLLSTLSLAGAGTAFLVVAAGYRLWKPRD